MESTENDNHTSDLDASDLSGTDGNQKSIRLPEPDADNITVLTKELPNDPILPWHRYDSPWLEAEAEPATESEEAEPSAAEDASVTVGRESHAEGLATEDSEPHGEERAAAAGSQLEAEDELQPEPQTTVPEVSPAHRNTSEQQPFDSTLQPKPAEARIIISES